MVGQFFNTTRELLITETTCSPVEKLNLERFKEFMQDKFYV